MVRRASGSQEKAMMASSALNRKSLVAFLGLETFMWFAVPSSVHHIHHSAVTKRQVFVPPKDAIRVAKLSEVLFVETLRRFIQDLPDQQKGWLAGARDPVIGEALALLHKYPARPWTIATLAHQVGVSRTRFVERFRHFLGEPPMAYLARWRLKLAAEILGSSNANVGEIAAEVGYASEAAFNRAFKRQFGCPPARFRRSRSVRYRQSSL
jgi:AraC-like DNA-binding protein